jgi:hypothetical protein
VLIANEIIENTDNHRRAYAAQQPIARWHTLPGFLREGVAQRIWRACESAEYRTFCGYMRPGETGYRNEFHEPDPQNTYISVHKRSEQLAPLLVELEQAMGSPETLAVLRELTGEPLERLGRVSTLTCWEPESFAAPHTDSGVTEGGARLVLWIWFASAWQRAFGGTTGFQWPSMAEPITMLPEFNRAVLFRPFSGSFHWVTPLTPSAPQKARFTWTLHYC